MKTPTHATKLGSTRSLVECARRLTRLQAKRRKLRAELRVVDSEVRATNRELRVLAADASAGTPDQFMPQRLFGEVQGGKR